MSSENKCYCWSTFCSRLNKIKRKTDTSYVFISKQVHNKGKDSRPISISPCVSQIFRSLTAPSNTLPVSLRRVESSSSRGNRESFSHIRTSSRLHDKSRYLLHTHTHCCQTHWWTSYRMTECQVLVCVCTCGCCGTRVCAGLAAAECAVWGCVCLWPSRSSWEVRPPTGKTYKPGNSETKKQRFCYQIRHYVINVNSTVKITTLP